jgi:hypothetical protein
MRAFVAACVFAVVVLPAIGQTPESGEQKHVIAWAANDPLPGLQLSALSIVRGAEYPSVVYLKGNVEVKSPVCLPVGRKRSLVCDGYMVLRADSVEFHEDTGRIDAHGNVSITHLEHKTAR